MKLSFSPKDRILIVAPHPDDETIGTGGVLVLFGAQVDVLILTDGCKGKSENYSFLSEKELTVLRKEEARSAMKLAGVREVFFFDIPDTQLFYNRKKVELFDYSLYDYIFIPSDNESHIDHLAANYFIRSIRNRKKTFAKLFGYEVWKPLNHVNAILDISSVEAKKAEIISCYASQLDCFNYIDAIQGLNHYRALTFQVKSVEAFEYIPCCTLEVLSQYYKIFRLKIGLFIKKIQARFR